MIKIAFATTIPTDTVPFISAVKSVNKATGNLVNAKLMTGGDFRELVGFQEFIEFAKESNMVFVHLMGDLPGLDKLIATLRYAHVPFMAVSSVFGKKEELMQLSTVSRDDYIQFSRYINYGGKKNFENLLRCLMNRFAEVHVEVAPPSLPPWEGLYHPDFTYTPTMEEYKAKKISAGKPSIGILFHQNYWQGENTSFVDALIREIERQDANVVPLFVSGRKDTELEIRGLEWAIDEYFMENGKPFVDVIISTLSFSLSTSTSTTQNVHDVLRRLGVPVIKAIMTCNTLEEWQTSMQGLNTFEIPSAIAMPEFDGLLIAVPIAALSTAKTDPLTGSRILHFEPIEERIAKLVRLSLKWAKLRRIPNRLKRVAIIFHNYPPRNDLIGHAFGLDAPESVWRIIRAMNKSGYTLKWLPENGREILDALLKGLTNDRRWASSEELAKKAIDCVSIEQYMEWYNELPLDVRVKMEEHWGKPPGKLFTYKDKLLIGGIINGNLFIGLQPPRGFIEDPASIYHSPDLPMPHHYYAYYRWVRDVFKADVVLHIGKHGTLEWLPGKSVGLSASCLPDAVISDMPNIYPYIINNPGEGTQPKRRSYCCIIDHMVPAMQNADAYEDIAKLEVQLNEYYQQKTSTQEKKYTMQKLIWEKTCQAKLNQDLNVTEETVFKDFDAFIEKLHGYINELTDAQIRDGLHILGDQPSNSKLTMFIHALTRLNNGPVPSLRQSIAEAKERDYEDLVANRGRLNSDGRTNGDILKEIDNLSVELIKRFQKENFNVEMIDDLIQEVLGVHNVKVKQCLAYIACFLVPALNATVEEMANTLSACEGCYVLPGPSGSPTRGMADILPTGRNFYSVDPRAIPSTAAWRVGVALGDALLERYRNEEGKYPESVGIIVWATDTMKTKGDDIAEILYLMGAKPIWEETSGRVVGVTAIPLEELKRPRIDVTVRISGLFRDTFPNVVHLIDDAVRLVASLKEPAEMNYVAKHVASEVRERVSSSADVEHALEEACYRVFGDRPGAYGCGVSEAIDSKNWKTQADLAHLYVTWGGYAYGRKNFGVQVPEVFKRRLSKIAVTVKNQDSREYDILDGDDWYDAHGGMITAIKTYGGKPPRSYCGDSSDPNRVKVRSTYDETAYIFRSRLLNPKWINSVKRHGYQGAGDLSRTIDFVFGWDATVEVVEDWMYEELAKKYVLDPEMQQWLKQVNPYALQNMVERFLEAIERNLWQASEEMKKELERIYLDIEGLLEDVSGEK